MKKLFLDIETAPNTGAYFQLYREGNIVWTEKDWYILSFSAKWAGQKKVHTYALPDFELYKKDRENDLALLGVLHDMLSEADVVVAHNGDAFDMKKIRTRLLIQGFDPIPPLRQVDTKKVAKSIFGFDSNKLNDLGRQLGVGQKIDNGGIDLWREVLAGVPAAWKMMKKYNEQDVILLEAVYDCLGPWMTNHPNANLYSGTSHNCPFCGGGHTQQRGTFTTTTGRRQRYQCQDCGKWSKGEIIKTNVVLK